MEFLFELLFEFIAEVVVQFLFELVLETGARGVAQLLKNRVVRGLLGAVLLLGGAFAGGLWWGARLTELGRTDPPRSLWVSIGLGGAFLAAAMAQWLRDRRRPDRETRPSSSRSLRPWHWRAGRLTLFAAINVAVATGIATGFDPRPLR
jgi:hypothetical protein